MKPRDIILVFGIGWLAIGIAAAGTGVLGFFQSLLFPFPDEEFPFSFAFLDVFVRYRRELTIGQAIVGIFIIVCAIAFLRRHNWSRYVLQVFAALNILWGIIFGISWIQGVRTITTAATDNPFFEYFGLAMIIFGVGVILSLSAMWSFCIWLLSQPRIRNEFTK
jgi:hypothetical protein